MQEDGRLAGRVLTRGLLDASIGLLTDEEPSVREASLVLLQQAAERRSSLQHLQVRAASSHKRAVTNAHLVTDYTCRRPS